MSSKICVFTGEDFNEVSKFKGLNFVFNDRMAEVRIKRRRIRGVKKWEKSCKFLLNLNSNR